MTKSPKVQPHLHAVGDGNSLVFYKLAKGALVKPGGLITRQVDATDYRNTDSCYARQTILQYANLHITKSDSFVRFDRLWISPLLLSLWIHISKLDYCNSLLNGLQKSSINRLQVVQNSLARTIYPSAKRSDHISPVLHKLHWLPVSRIEFKIATLTFKVLKFQQPAYIYDLIAP